MQWVTRETCKIYIVNISTFRFCTTISYRKLYFWLKWISLHHEAYKAMSHLGQEKRSHKKEYRWKSSNSPSTEWLRMCKCIIALLSDRVHTLIEFVGTAHWIKTLFQWYCRRSDSNSRKFSCLVILAKCQNFKSLNASRCGSLYWRFLPRGQEKVKQQLKKYQFI